jgi:hypothetical protein
MPVSLYGPEMNAGVAPVEGATGDGTTGVGATGVGTTGVGTTGVGTTGVGTTGVGATGVAAGGLLPRNCLRNAYFGADASELHVGEEYVCAHGVSRS